MGTHNHSSFRLLSCTSHFKAECCTFCTHSTLSCCCQCASMWASCTDSACCSSKISAEECEELPLTCAVCLQAHVMTMTMFTVRARSLCPYEILRQLVCSVLVSERLFHPLIPPAQLPLPSLFLQDLMTAEPLYCSRYCSANPDDWLHIL